eukprot:scaffold83_cov286-Prasinococcus_capsulatus_cf.AAC.9
MLRRGCSPQRPQDAARVQRNGLVRRRRLQPGGACPQGFESNMHRRRRQRVVTPTNAATLTITSACLLGCGAGRCAGVPEAVQTVHPDGQRPGPALRQRARQCPSVLTQSGRSSLADDGARRLLLATPLPAQRRRAPRLWLSRTAPVVVARRAHLPRCTSPRAASQPSSSLGGVASGARPRQRAPRERLTSERLAWAGEAPPSWRHHVSDDLHDDHHHDDDHDVHVPAP